MRRAFDAGVNYFDVAPAYGRNGDCEIKMGIGLQEVKIPRDEIFLSCKTRKRDAAGAREELERSLTRLKTDHFDLYQLHVMSTDADVKQVLGPGGAMETLLKARDEGKVRWLGFSAHTKPAALALLKQFKFDTVMYPVNFIEHFQHQFDPEVLQLCRSEGAAAIAIKPISAGDWKPGEQRTRNNWWYRVLEEPKEIEQAIRFSLSFDPVVTVLSTSFFDLTDHSIAAGKAYRPATDADLAGMRELAGKYVPLFKPKAATVEWSPHSHYYANVA
jgi:aryl-alcohol dehydrogenase-like predicted oxidoreductase